MIAYFITAGSATLVTLLSCLWYFKRKAARIRLAHQQQVSELEDIAWRAQMNPHFLNNCLNSINALINQHDKPLATHYVSNLSRLTRNILESSQERVITLADELDAVQQYVALERLRFGDGLLVNVSLASGVDPAHVMVPPLFIQPFIENAIVHGLLPRGTGGTVDIAISIQDGVLCCTVADDGIGREARNRIIRDNGFRKSMGIAITRKRIAHFNARHGCTLPFVIRDRMDAEGSVSGTVVEVQLALVNDT